MKKEIEPIDCVPSKRLFLSIISDYNLNLSICELIDNAIDIWNRSERRKHLNIIINSDKDQQTISISDNAGGVKQSELHFLLGPGHTGNTQTDETIGIFGVGTKRAVVALAQDIKITTRHEKGKTYQVEFDYSWLSDDDWKLPAYEVDDIGEGTTLIELQKLRSVISEEAINKLKDHLQATYAQFLGNNNITIQVDSDTLSHPIFFNNWAYPPNYLPHKYEGTILTEGKSVRVEVLAGLANESSPAGMEYGVYIYCNDRLIARALKNEDVGFAKGLAGKQHPSVSLVRIIVFLKGDAQSMPWNSSKSGINSNHKVFVALRNWLVQIVKDYAVVSRALSKKEGGWPENVFKYTTGGIVDVKIGNFAEATKSYLPPLPKSKPRYGDLIKDANIKVAEEKPWTKGLYEGVVAANMIFNQNLEQKNRICLIILDSVLEIAFKEFLVNDSGEPYNDKRLQDLFSKRDSVELEVQRCIAKKDVAFSSDPWQKIKYYYRLRCKLVHERATAGITDDQVKDYQEVVQKMLETLFKLRFDF